jgi:hypothetical protein
MIHPPNTTPWRVGDIVIHDDDAKRVDMLMVVVGVSRAGVYRTRYAFPMEQPRAWRRKVWRNTIESLHDPARFGIVVRRCATTPAAPSSTPARSTADPPPPGRSATS